MSLITPNRIVAFLGPILSIIAGVIADWLLAMPHGPDVLGIFGTTDKTAITAWLTQALVFSLTAILSWLGQQKWLTGWIAWEARSEPGPSGPSGPAEAPGPATSTEGNPHGD